MRTAHVVACASALLLTTGALAAGCISSDGTAPDAGSDSGAFDAFVSSDAGSSDAGSADAGQIDAAPNGSFDAAVFNTPIDFGLVNCGTGSASKTFSFTNPGPGSVDYSATVGGSAVFSIDGPSSGTIAQGATASITIVASSIPTTSIAGTAITGALYLQLQIPNGGGTSSIPLTVTPQGGSLTVSPALAGFGQVQLATSGAPIPLTIANVGNAPVSITFGGATSDAGAADTEFGVTYPSAPAALTIAPGASIEGDAGAAATFAPTTAGLKAVMASIQTSDPLCASATSIAMSGTGTAAQVTVGPDPLPFGTTLCGQTGAPLQVTIRNSSPAAVSFTDALTLGASSPFTISTAGSSVPGGTLQNPGLKTITVTPKKINAPASIVPGAFNDTLTVTPTAPGVSATAISLQQSAAGAILVVTMSTKAFGTVVNQSSSLPFTVTNSGNRDAPLTLTPGGVGYSASFTASATAVADGGMASGNVTFVPSSNGADDGSLTVTTTAAQCSAAPAAVNVTATGAVPVAQYAATPIAVGSTCGGGAGTSGGLTITNNGNSPLTISNITSQSGHFSFTNPGSIAAGGTASITVTASPIAVGSGPLGGTALDDVLGFQTNEVGSPTHTVPVTVAVSGANLAFSGGDTATLTTCGGVGYAVTNTGDMDAYVTAGGTYPTDVDSANDPNIFNFQGAFGSPTLISAGGTPVADVLDHGVGICGVSGTCTLSGTQTFTSANAVGSVSQIGICVPLPPLNMSIAFGLNCTHCC